MIAFKTLSAAVGCAALMACLGDARTVGAQLDADYERARETMVRTQIATGIFGRRAVKDERVLAAMQLVPRHEFVPEELRREAYIDSPLPIGEGQTISQPYIVATMTEALQVEPEDKVLEIGTGSGYQAAVLAELALEVYTIEIVRELGERAGRDLKRLGYSNVYTRIGDGYRGWPEAAPFDKIIVTAAPDHVPQPLVEQLKPGGRMIIPVGREYGVQQLQLIEKLEDGTTKTATLEPVRFVPLTGEAQRNER